MRDLNAFINSPHISRPTIFKTILRASRDNSAQEPVLGLKDWDRPFGSGHPST